MNAMFQTVICCEFSVETEVDLREVEEWYSKSAIEGDMFATERLGYLCLESDLPRKKKFFEWFLKTAMEDVLTAMHTV